METINFGLWRSLCIFEALKAFVEEWEAKQWAMQDFWNSRMEMDQWLVFGGTATWVITWVDERMDE